MSTDQDDETETGIVSGKLSVNIQDIFGLGKATKSLSPAANKLVEAFASAIGIIANPTKIYLEERALGAANRHEALASARTSLEIDKLLEDNPNVAARLKLRLIKTEIRRQLNIEAAFSDAIRIADENHQTKDAHDIQDDFMSEWVEGVRDVSDPEVRQLWSGLLASAPVKELGRASKPAIDLLKQFDSSIARMFTDFIAITQNAGPPSTKIADWSEFGITLDFDLLFDISVITNVIPAKIPLPGIGTAEQMAKKSDFGLGLMKTTEVWALKPRALELANLLFSKILPLPENQEYDILKRNITSHANDDHHNLVIFRVNEGNELKYLYSISKPEKKSENVIKPERSEITNKFILNDPKLSENGRKLLLDFAENGNLILRYISKSRTVQDDVENLPSI